MHMYLRNNRQTVTSRQHSGYAFIFSPSVHASASRSTHSWIVSVWTSG